MEKDIEALRAQGVEIYGEGVYIEEGCEIESGAKIYAPSHISDGSQVSRGASIMPYCFLQRAYVGENTVVFSSTLTDAQVCENCTVGPYAYLRGGTYVGKSCRIGDFVEIKSSSLGEGTKVAHLAYIGDARIGRRVNVGCGVVFANYNGKIKQNSTIGDGAFIGCNSNIVAPVTVGDGAYIAAGTTVTGDLGENDFCIGRAREHIKKGAAAGRYTPF